MPLSSTTLANEIEALTPTATAGVAESRLAAAYGNYMHGALTGAGPIIAAAVDALAVPAMADAMAFEAGATAAQGAAIVRDGVAEFWIAMSASPASFFAGAMVIAPPSFAALTAALTAVFEAAAADSSTLEEAATAIAAALHAATAGQGTALFPGPIVSVIS